MSSIKKMKIILVFITLCISSLNSVVLYCRYSFEWWPASDEKYSCVTTLSEVSTNQRLTAVNGDHLVGKNYSDVESIDFAGCSGSTFIPRRMLNFFPNLVGIRLDNCGILVLSGNELNEYERLTHFAVESTQLERIPGNFFASTPEISVIGFAENQLKYVGYNLLRNLTNLLWISFNNNDCISQTATTSEEIDALIENLTEKCVDVFETTTALTTITTEMSSTESSTIQVTEATTPSKGVGVEINFLVMILVVLKFQILS